MDQSEYEFLGIEIGCNSPQDPSIFLDENIFVILDPENKVNLVNFIKEHIQLKSNYEELKKDYEELKKTVNEIYYSPNGPGFVEAQTHFDSQIYLLT